MDETPTSERKTPSWTSITLCSALAAASVVTIDDTFLELTDIQKAFLTVAIAAIVLCVLYQIDEYIIER